MFKIPPDYHLKQMTKSDTPQKWYNHYVAFVSQSVNQATFACKFYTQKMSEVVKKFIETK